jgi:putative transposase
MQILLAVDLFDNWFDPLEAEVRARARQFIEELLRGELDAALARLRYGRSQIAGKDGLRRRHGRKWYRDGPSLVGSRSR